MILYLLCSALILDFVESQPANITVEKLDEVGRNQTFNSTMKSKNVTSRFYEDKKKLEDELQSHQKSAVTEDNEGFQDMEDNYAGQHCNQTALTEYTHNICGVVFHQEMLNISRDNWCVLEQVIRPYNDLTICVEDMAQLTSCFFPNPDIQEFFVYIHYNFFLNCTNRKLQLLEDAPQGVVIGLTLLSVSLIPVLVYLVARKS